MVDQHPPRVLEQHPLRLRQNALVAATVCPECLAEVPVDPLYIPWCDVCGWNVDPDPPKVSDEERRRMDRLAAGLFEEVCAASSLQPKWGMARVVAFLLAAGIHALTLGVFLLGAWLIRWAWPSPIGVIVGLLIIGVAVHLRPRWGKRDRKTLTVGRDDCPALFGLLDQIADSVGSKRVALVQLDGRFNASFSWVGLRRERVVTLGVPVWAAATGQERVALLGHELAHDANKDVTHHVFVRTALWSLSEWHDILRPVPQRSSRGIVALAEWFLLLVFWPLRMAIRGLFHLQKRLMYRDSQRAEYLADQLAAGAGSTEATISLLDKFVFAPGCARAVDSARRANDRVNTAEIVTQYLASVPERERERLRRQDRARGQRVDVTHPPTYARIDVLRARARVEAAVFLDREIERRITHELNDAIARYRDRVRPVRDRKVVLPGVDAADDSSPR